jgi:hypothetical protein
MKIENNSSSLLANLPHKPYFWIFLFFVGLFTWGASPINAWHAIGLVLFALVAIVLSRQVNRKAFPLALLALLLTTIDIFGVATLHDLNVKSYASALCCDGSYSYSEHHQGTCSWHHGVCEWRPELPPWWETF